MPKNFNLFKIVNFFENSQKLLNNFSLFELYYTDSGDF